MLALLATLLLAAADTAAPTIDHTPAAKAPRGKELVIEARITDPSGVFGSTLYWRPALEQKYIVVELTAEGGNLFTGAIPGARMNNEVEYYIESYDQLGNGPARAGSPENPFLVVVHDAVVPREKPEVASAVLEPQEPPLKVVPLAVGGGGVLLAGVGAALWFSAAATVRDIDQKYPANTGLLPDDAAAVRSAAGTSRLGSILMIAGGLAAAGGTTWFFMPSDDGGATVGAGGRF
jgi:hypothetical protein